jgi:hypothetical protein
MNIGLLMMRVLDDHGAIYCPGAFTDDNWLDWEKSLFLSTLWSLGVPAKIDAGFNRWIFSKDYDGRYMTWRETWESGSFHGSMAEVTTKLADYYHK